MTRFVDGIVAFLKRAVPYLAFFAVLGAAAVLSFEHLKDFAVAIGISEHIAFLFPIAIDGGVAVSGTVWLTVTASDDARRFAKWLNLILIAVTVSTNSVQIGLHHTDPLIPWWLAALGGALPPAIVGATEHLLVLYTRSGGQKVSVQPNNEQQTPVQQEPVQTPVQPNNEQRRVSVQPNNEVVQETAVQQTPVQPAEQREQPNNVQETAVQPNSEQAPEQSEQPRVQLSAVGSDERLSDFKQWVSELNETPSNNAVRTRYSCGYNVANKLLSSLEKSA